MRRDFIQTTWVVYLVYALALYISLSCAVYRFRHQEQTDTQLFLHIPDALRFR